VAAYILLDRMQAITQSPALNIATEQQPARIAPGKTLQSEKNTRLPTSDMIGAGRS
jgi:hypothetical protein